MTTTITTMTAVTGNCNFMKKKIKQTTAYKEFMALLPYYLGMLALLGIIGVILMASGIGD